MRILTSEMLLRVAFLAVISPLLILRANANEPLYLGHTIDIPDAVVKSCTVMAGRIDSLQADNNGQLVATVRFLNPGPMGSFTVRPDQDGVVHGALSEAFNRGSFVVVSAGPGETLPTAGNSYLFFVTGKPRTGQAVYPAFKILPCSQADLASMHALIWKMDHAADAKRTAAAQHH